MKVQPTSLPGVLLFEPTVHTDARGWVYESFHVERYAQAGLTSPFVQDNQARSVAGCVRGLHYQLRRPQGKLVRVVRGSAFDVCVDIRVGSPTFGRWFAEMLTEANRLQLYVPPGFAHGYCVPDGECELVYKCTDFWDPSDEYGIRWDDPAIGIPWPVTAPILSERDRSLPLLSDAGANLPRYREPNA